MKTTNTEIRAALERVQTFTRSLTNTRKELAGAQRDAGLLETVIAELGEPSYSDDATIEQLGLAQKKLELCQKTIARLSEKNSASSAPYSDAARAIAVSSGLAVRILTEILEVRITTATCHLRILSKDEGSARRLAMESDIVKSARRTIAYFAHV